MRIDAGGNAYEWVDSWAHIPDKERGVIGFAHHGVAVTEADQVLLFHQADTRVQVFDRQGNFLRSWDSDLTNGHGMTLVKEGRTEYLWLADNYRDTPNDRSGSGSRHGQAAKMTLDGRTVMTIQQPDLPIYRDRVFAPTSVAVNEERHGGNGDIWVADGYGERYVHRYDKHGNYMDSITGKEGRAGAFESPHGLLIDRRKSDPELYISEQRNGRIQVYDLEGNFKRAFGQDFLAGSSAFTAYGDLILVVELRSRLAILDSKDKLVGYLGAYQESREIKGWPNIPIEHVKPGKFVAPHGLAADRDGNLYVVEWIIGGRVTKLVKV